MAEPSDSTTPSPSPGSSSGYGGITESLTPGHPKQSFMRKYFVYNKDNNKSVCHVDIIGIILSSSVFKLNNLVARGKIRRIMVIQEYTNSDLVCLLFSFNSEV